MQYLLDKGLVHKDLSLRNLLLHSPQFVLKIADFGFASLNGLHRGFQGTHGFIAPEIYENITYDGEKKDIFASGVILFNMVMGISPF